MRLATKSSRTSVRIASWESGIAAGAVVSLSFVPAPSSALGSMESFSKTHRTKLSKLSTSAFSWAFLFCSSAIWAATAWVKWAQSRSASCLSILISPVPAVASGSARPSSSRAFENRSMTATGLNCLIASSLCCKFPTHPATWEEVFCFKSFPATLPLERRSTPAVSTLHFCSTSCSSSRFLEIVFMGSSSCFLVSLGLLRHVLFCPEQSLEIQAAAVRAIRGSLLRGVSLPSSGLSTQDVDKPMEEPGY
mmetsp:Transcript_76949/g.205652  ORF Transcript_76949/g.205652 Transcript_76949/m.205652 type:complete len:250 (-) Transcript_76949:52-801(-)